MIKHFFNIFKKIAPWLMAVLIFVYIFREYDPAQVLKALKFASLGYFLVLALSYFTLLYIVDCLTMRYTLNRFGHDVCLKDLFPARGVTYLIMNINYPASQAAFAYYLKRTHNIPITEVLSVFFFIAIVDIYIVMSLAFVGSFFQHAIIRGISISFYVKTFVLIAYGILFLHLMFWRNWITKITKIKLDNKFFKWIRTKKIFSTFSQATVFDYLKLALYRSPIHIAIVLFLFLAIKTFHASIPLITVIGSIPIAFMIGTLPITPGGLGTTNVAIIELVHPHVSGDIISSGVVTPQELLLAVTIIWMVFNALVKSLIGIVWLQKVSKSLFKPTECIDQKDIAVSKNPTEVGNI